MKLNKFKCGDVVTNPYGAKCRVVKIVSMQPEIEYLVVLDHGKNVKYKYREDQLKFWHNEPPSLKEPESYPDLCPKCGGEWKKTGFGQKVWLDCPNCNETAEKLCHRYRYYTPSSYKPASSRKLLIDDDTDIFLDYLLNQDDDDVF